MNREELQFDDEPVANLLRELKHVDAPKDFDFKVRARIAAGRPSETRTTGIPMWVKSAVPLGLVIAVGGYFGLNAIYTPVPTDVPAVAVVESPLKDPSTPSLPQAPNLVVPSNDVIEGKWAVLKPTNTNKSVRRTQPSGGSVDLAIRKGNSLDIRDRSANDAFTEIGVSGTFDDAGMKIGSAATRSGLKTGDVVESINGTPVDANSKVKGRLAGKTLRVRRDGKTVDIVIKN